VARGSDSRIRFARENLGRVIARRAVRANQRARSPAAMIGFYDFCFRDSFIASERRVDGSATAMPTRWIPMMDSSKKSVIASWCQE
jgi:hypothetical protein